LPHHPTSFLKKAGQKLLLPEKLRFSGGKSPTLENYKFAS
jgi:hypothetical protein